MRRSSRHLSMLMLRRFLVYGFVLSSLATLAAQPDVSTLGPQVGQRLAPFSGVDQFGRTQTLTSIMGPEGAMVVFYRSADW